MSTTPEPELTEHEKWALDWMRKHRFVVPLKAVPDLLVRFAELQAFVPAGEVKQ